MKAFCLELSGPWACFTRPEMKVERVSYDVMTPSAARACFEAILWKPAIRWQVRKIEVLKPAMKNGRGDLGLNIEDDRQQRAGLFLRDVAYRVHADLEFLSARDPDASATKYFEFAANFRLVGDPTAEPLPHDETRDLGFMLHDLDFSKPADPQPRFFRARLENGVVQVPAWDSVGVRK
ncbi:MAG: type I-C CRISPR-associated protein Cas5 [Thiobacillus sp. SCN 63-374]|nr:MAG: type I-C CRISPR-associated protein Cas5 [Thiobacillus sp. SCN 63-374]